MNTGILCNAENGATDFLQLQILSLSCQRAGDVVNTLKRELVGLEFATYVSEESPGTIAFINLQLLIVVIFI